MSALEADRPTAVGGRPIADLSAECAGPDGAGGSAADVEAEAEPQERAGTIVVDAEASASVAEMMLEDGALAVLADVVALRPPPCHADGGQRAAKGGAHAAETLASAVEVAVAESSEASDDESLRLEALEAAVLMLQGRPRAQAEFARLGGHSRICRLVHDLAETTSQRSAARPPASQPSADHAADRGRSRSKSRTESLPPQEEQPAAAAAAGELDAAFDAVFRLALDGHAAAAGARADGLDAVRTLLVLAARSPSLPVALRAARGLQALLRVRPLNAVSIERQDGLRVVSDAIADLAFSGSRHRGSEAPAADRPPAGKGEVGFGGLGAEQEDSAAAARLAWLVDDKREALTSLNEVVRAVAAVYSRRDARALDSYASILRSCSTARRGVGFDSPGELSGTRCSGCGAERTGAPGRGSALHRCLSEGCKGAAGLCSTCDETLHDDTGKDSCVRLPVVASVCEQQQQHRGSGGSRGAPSPHGADPSWAIEAGRALMKAMSIMLDDRESSGLPPTPDREGDITPNTTGAPAAAAEQAPLSGDTTSVLACMLQIIQDELLGPLNRHDRWAAAEGNSRGGFSSSVVQQASHLESGWTQGWLLGALEVVARVAVRGDSATIQDLGAAGGWGLLAHLARLPVPPQHLSAGTPLSGVGAGLVGQGEGVAPRASTSAGSEGNGEPRSGLDRGSQEWVGWIGARRLALWIVREALLTGTAGQSRSSSSRGGTSSASLLEQPARWLIWLVQAVMKETPAGACSESQVRTCNCRDLVLSVWLCCSSILLEFRVCKVCFPGFLCLGLFLRASAFVNEDQFWARNSVTRS